jgi:hypothetical protein
MARDSWDRLVFIFQHGSLWERIPLLMWFGVWAMLAFVLVIVLTSASFRFIDTPGPELGAFRKGLGILVMLASAGALYAFKAKRQKWYGIVEVSFATAVSWRALGGFVADPVANFLALMAALYLMSHGIANLVEGLKKGAEPVASGGPQPIPTA